MDRNTPEAEVGALVDAVRRHPERRDALVDLLPERIPLYSGRSANAVVRLRGYVLSVFEQVGLPPAALPYVLDELQNGRDAYLVAAAAMALRGLDHPPSDAVPSLLQAIENIKYVDDALAFDSCRPQWPAAEPTTAMAEILKTFAWLGDAGRAGLPALEALSEERDVVSPGARATLESVLARMREVPSCCHHAEAPPAAVVLGRGADDEPPVTEVPYEVKLQDQDGEALVFGGFFRGQPSVVAFFYTRCDNPNKCSLTITRLGEVQRLLGAAGLDGRVRTAAITYDPDFDLPPRLRAYGENRGVTFTANDRLLRTTSGFEVLEEYFQLGVNYGPTLVNRHRIELFVLDPEARIAHTFARLQWDPDEVVARATELTGAQAVAQH